MENFSPTIGYDGLQNPVNITPIAIGFGKIVKNY